MSFERAHRISGLTEPAAPNLILNLISGAPWRAIISVSVTVSIIVAAVVTVTVTVAVTVVVTVAVAVAVAAAVTARHRSDWSDCKDGADSVV